MSLMSISSVVLGGVKVVVKCPVAFVRPVDGVKDPSFIANSVMVAFSTGCVPFVTYIVTRTFSFKSKIVLFSMI